MRLRMGGDVPAPFSPDDHQGPTVLLKGTALAATASAVPPTSRRAAATALPKARPEDALHLRSQHANVRPSSAAGCPIHAPAHEWGRVTSILAERSPTANRSV